MLVGWLTGGPGPWGGHANDQLFRHPPDGGWVFPYLNRDPCTVLKELKSEVRSNYCSIDTERNEWRKAMGGEKTERVEKAKPRSLKLGVTSEQVRRRGGKEVPKMGERCVGKSSKQTELFTSTRIPNLPTSKRKADGSKRWRNEKGQKRRERKGGW